MVSQTLKLLEVWFVEPTLESERPKLLSKLAVLEFCGWLEGWMDDFVIEISGKCLSDDTWVKKNVVQTTYGFDYNKHLRPMICKILGEHLARVAELRLDAEYPGDLEQIRSMLGSLWRVRCEFAHNELSANVSQQATFHAPSWTTSQYNMLSEKLERMRKIYHDVALNIPKK